MASEFNAEDILQVKLAAGLLSKAFTLTWVYNEVYQRKLNSLFFLPVDDILVHIFLCVTTGSETSTNKVTKYGRT